METIAPHGGVLIDRLAKTEERDALLEKAESLKKVTLSDRELSDLDLIAVGAFSPLEGFMVKDDYENVLQNMRLQNGLAWTIPVTLCISDSDSANISVGSEITLVDGEQKIMAIMQVEDKFEIDPLKEAQLVYKTEDQAHPGVAYVYQCDKTAIGGKITVLNRVKYTDFPDNRYDPAQSRELFKQKGWKRIVGFQTRNPIHRAHEYIQKCALEVVDGLLLHPIVGWTKGDDIPADVRMDCYKVLLKDYYPKDRVVLGVLPAAMRYAGPREAIFHAIIRKNYGCTHFIVGRDHAGVGNYYGSFDAHYIFDEFDKDELEITPLFFDYTFYCKSCEGMASFKTCPHGSEQHVSLSGTKVREMLAAGEIPPVEFSRPEVAQVLIDSMK